VNREYLKTFKGISLPLVEPKATASISGAPLDYPCESCSICENESIEREIARNDRWEKVQIVALCVLAYAVLFVAGCQGTAHAYTDEQIVNAIYRAEGGEKAKYPYGIRSIKCESKEECKRICANTVRNNRKRFARNAGGSKDFISFLGKRYCPIGASNDPQGLNKNWEKNVRYFLARAK
jgi:hypothetical protein